MAGVAVVAGIFPPASVVVLRRVTSEAVLRPEGGEEIERRLVDENGNVGFSGLIAGERYFASGYVDGFPIDVRCRAVDSEAPDSELAQAPIKAAVPKTGYDSTNAPAPPPAAPDEALEAGVPVQAQALVAAEVSAPVEEAPAVTIALAAESAEVPPAEEAPPPAGEPVEAPVEPVQEPGAEPAVAPAPEPEAQPEAQPEPPAQEPEPTAPAS